MANTLSGFTVSASSITATLNGLAVVNEKVLAALKILAKTAANLMENYAKENAIWTDRTTNARQGLLGEADWENSHILTVAVMHQMDYGIWLELAMEKKYAILEQAMNSQKDQLIAEIKKLVGDRT